MDGATIGVRPEHLLVGPDGPWQGTVSHAEHLGADTMLHVEVPGLGLLTARTAGDAPGTVGENIGIEPRDGKMFRFDADGRTPGG